MPWYVISYLAASVEGVVFLVVVLGCCFFVLWKFSKTVLPEFVLWMFVLTVVMIGLLLVDFSITTQAMPLRWIYRSHAVFYGSIVAGLIMLLGWLVWRMRMPALFKAVLFLAAAVYILLMINASYRCLGIINHFVQTYDVSGMIAVMTLATYAGVLVVFACVYGLGGWVKQICFRKTV